MAQFFFFFRSLLSLSLEVGRARRVHRRDAISCSALLRTHPSLGTRLPFDSIRTELCRVDFGRLCLSLARSLALSLRVPVPSLRVVRASSCAGDGLSSEIDRAYLVCPWVNLWKVTGEMADARVRELIE